jgi:hypothetical protein
MIGDLANNAGVYEYAPLDAITVCRQIVHLMIRLL